MDINLPGLRVVWYTRGMGLGFYHHDESASKRRTSSRAVNELNGTDTVNNRVLESECGPGCGLSLNNTN